MFLGVVLDEKLKFSQHITHVSSKISKSIGILYKLRNYLPLSTMKSLYYSFVYPYLMYANLVWGSTYPCHLRSLELLQKKVIRIINCANFLDHTNELFLRNSILKLNDINLFLTALYMFNNKNSPRFSSNHDYNTRLNHAPNSQFQRLSLTQHSVFFRGPIVWNSLPENIKTCRTVENFKKKLKMHLINSYN